MPPSIKPRISTPAGQSGSALQTASMLPSI